MGDLNILQWATHSSIEDDATGLVIWTADELESQMSDSIATGKALVSNGHLGVDLIRTPAGQGFLPHTHPGDHLLIVVGGFSTITFDGVIYGAPAGTLYAIDGSIPHAVGGVTDVEILAVGSPHHPVDSPDRMSLVEYKAVLSPTSATMTCEICDETATLPAMLHDRGCPHCPCPYDLSTGNEELDLKLRQELDWLIMDSRGW